MNARREIPVYTELCERGAGWGGAGGCTWAAPSHAVAPGCRERSVKTGGEAGNILAPKNLMAPAPGASNYGLLYTAPPNFSLAGCLVNRR
jgi:hypothetical protein